MDELYYIAIDMLKELITTPSISRDEKDAADIIFKYIKSAGIEPQRHGNNVWAIANNYNPQQPTLLLNSHIDTVKPVDAWTYNPFTPLLTENGCLYGLGSNDAGASVVSLFATFIHLNSINRNYNLIFLASCEEEVSGKNGIESVIPLLPHIDVAIVGEPTGMHPAVAERGLMVLDGDIKGISGHAARNEGVNAIYNALPVIEKIRNLTFPKVSPTLGPVKITVTQISAGTQHNVIPDSCRIVVDVRTTDAYTNIETLEAIKNTAPEANFIPRSTRLNPSHIDIEHPIIKRLILMGKEPFGSPTLSDQALMPWQSVKLGPGQSSRSHTANEHIYLDEIRDAINTYIKLLTDLAL